MNEYERKKRGFQIRIGKVAKKIRALEEILYDESSDLDIRTKEDLERELRFAIRKKRELDIEYDKYRGYLSGLQKDPCSLDDIIVCVVRRGYIGGTTDF